MLSMPPGLDTAAPLQPNTVHGSNNEQGVMTRLISRLGLLRMGMREPASAPVLGVSLQDNFEAEDAEAALKRWTLSAPSLGERSERKRLASKMLTLGARLEEGAIVVPETLKITGLLKITELPPSLSIIHGRLLISKCKSLQRLPGCLKIGGHFILSDCPRLQVMPQELATTGDLRLMECNKLTALADKMDVGGNVYISMLRQLKTLPAQLMIGGHVRLDNCENLTSLPENVGSLGPLVSGNPRTFEVHKCGLKPVVIDAILQSSLPGLFFILEDRVSELREFSGLDVLLGEWAIDQDKIRPDTWNLTDLDRENLQRFLGRIQDAPDAQREHTSEGLQKRVLHLMDGLQENFCHFREKALSIIHHSLANCDDRIMLAMNDLEILALVNLAENSAQPDQDLETLARGLFARDLLQRQANDISKQRMVGHPQRKVDQLSIYLALELALKDTFDIPTHGQLMQFEELAELKPEDISHVKRVIESKIDSEFKQYLSEWRPWQINQRRQEMDAWSIGRLPRLSQLQAGVEDEDMCPLTLQSVEELKQAGETVVCFSAGDHVVPVEFNALKQAWIENGNCFLTAQLIDAGDLMAKCSNLV